MQAQIGLGLTMRPRCATAIKQCLLLPGCPGLAYIWCRHAGLIVSIKSGKMTVTKKGVAYVWPPVHDTYYLCGKTWH